MQPDVQYAWGTPLTGTVHPSRVHPSRVHPSRALTQYCHNRDRSLREINPGINRTAPLFYLTPESIFSSTKTATVRSAISFISHVRHLGVRFYDYLASSDVKIEYEACSEASTTMLKLICCKHISIRYVIYEADVLYLVLTS